jgi:hypothetical protein
MSGLRASSKWRRLSKGTFVLPDATLENIQSAGEWLRPHFADENGRVRMSIHAYLVESAGQRIIVDTCIGNDKQRSFPGWNMLQTSFLTDTGRSRLSARFD